MDNMSDILLRTPPISCLGLTTSTIRFVPFLPMPTTSGLFSPPLSPIFFSDLFSPMLEYWPEAAISPAFIFVAILCKAEPCALPTIVVAPLAIFIPAAAAPVAPPIKVPLINPVHAPSRAPFAPPDAPPVIAPMTAPDAPQETAPDRAAPRTTAAAPPVHAVAIANQQ